MCIRISGAAQEEKQSYLNFVGDHYLQSKPTVLLAGPTATDFVFYFILFFAHQKDVCTSV